jgi:hypothetical protein
MKVLTTIVMAFLVFAYDISYNGGEITRWVASLIGG